MIRRRRRDGSLSPPRHRSALPWTEPGGREDDPVTLNKTPYQDLCHALEEARERSRVYRSQCAFFATQFERQFAEYLGLQHDRITFEPLQGARTGDGPVTVQEAMQLDEDTYWHVGLRLHIESEKGKDSILFHLRFKKMGEKSDDLYVVNLFGHEDFEVTEPSPTALRPIFGELYESLKRHYQDGLRLFLDRRGNNLHMPFTAARQGEIAGDT